MRKSFFAISPFCVALLIASYSSITAEAAAIVSLMEQEDPELDYLAQSSGIFSRKKKEEKSEEKKDEKKDEKEEEKGDEKEEEEEEHEIKNPFVKLTEDMRSDGQEGAAKLMDDASDAMKNVLYKIPYMKEVLISGELAKLAFDYLVA